ncbi:metallophosphoesterase [Desulfobulbus alkaliphilus]|uniref:metallophosphoesterase n=1 Tax=Desulfobulbus alkaliphilus TaxID=869814 RepID=UPI001964B8FB|nr:metallophosphoesterase [Desulfobulbus alkaliphilus]MBM9536121.1 metallophosphoesterase [Desulfobulbus alkaliphilus]
MTFFIIAALVYLSMHLLVWGRMGAQLDLGFGKWSAGLPVVLFMAATPFLAYLIPADWPQPLVRTLWWLVFVWMGILFYLFWLQLLSLVLVIPARVLPAAMTRWYPRGRRQLNVVLFLTAIIVLYGLYAATQWDTPRIELRTPLVAKDTRIVLVSDTHFGVMTRQAWVERLIAFIDDLEPDLVLLAGDQINDHPEWLEPKAAVIARLVPPLGVFGVLGNHEFYVGFQTSRAFHDLAGIRLLRNETLILPDSGIQLIGIDDPTWGHMDRAFMIRQLDQITPELSPDHFQILLTHRPWAWDEKAVPLGIQLMVAGHTHGGQIYPFHKFVASQYRYLAGHFQQNHSHLIVTTGAGTWGPPLRVGARPEVVVIDLIRDEEH